MEKFFLLLILISIFSPAIACSFAPGYEPLRVSSAYQSNFVPDKPYALITSVRRGYDDGNGGSCSDAGILTIKIDDSNPANRTAYKFKVLDNEAFSSIFPSEPVMIAPLERESSEMYFVWFDLGETQGKEMDFTLEIIAVSPSGEESEPFQLVVHEALR